MREYIKRLRLKKYKNLKRIEFDKIDFEKGHFHYTPRKNLRSIDKKGLLPLVGENSKVIERRKKVFFSEGDQATLKIMHAWIVWLKYRADGKYLYALGEYFMRTRWFPKIFIDIYMKVLDHSVVNDYFSLKELDRILRKSVYLNLNLEEGADFSYDDYDDVIKFHDKAKLTMVYFSEDELKNNKMLPWNMHTKKDVIIPPSKIKIVTINSKIVNAKKVLFHLAERNYDFVKAELPLLDAYFQKYLTKKQLKTLERTIAD